MSFVKIWVHLVWSTKNREPLLTKDIRKLLFQHIKENAQKKNIYIDFINGHSDHVHCLLALSADTALSTVVRLLKGESAYWMNKSSFLRNKLEWADEYFAVSISESILDKVRNYIRNQEEHHQRISFQQEYEKFLALNKPRKGQG